MKKIVLIMMVLALAGSMIFAQDISVKNETKLEFGTVYAGEDQSSNVGLNYLRNASSATIVGDLFKVTGQVRFALKPVFANSEDGKTLREEISYWTLSANDDTKINAYVEPIAGIQIAAGTHLEETLGATSIWWDEEQSNAFSFDGKKGKQYTFTTRYVNAGFMVKYTGVENLTAAFVLPTDEESSVNGASSDAYITSTEKAAILPMTFAVGYTVPEMVEAGVIAKLNVMGTDQMQFTATGNYLGLPMGTIGAYFTYATETDKDVKDGFMMAGVSGNMMFAGLKVSPEVSVYMPTDSKGHYEGLGLTDVKTGGLPLFAKVGLAYPMGVMTPSLDVLYSMAGTLETATAGYTTKDADMYLTFKPAFAYDFGVGTAKVGVEIDLKMQGDEIDSQNQWVVPISWTMMF